MSIHPQIAKAKDPAFKKKLIDFFESGQAITPGKQKSENWEIVHKNFRTQVLDSPTSFLQDINNNLMTRNDFSLIAESKGEARRNIINFYSTCLRERAIDPITLLDRCQESPLLSDEVCLELEGHRITTDLMRRLTHLSYIEAKLTVPDNGVILEIGAGHGAMARLLKTVYQSSTYVIIDLPETLYYSAGFLSSSFPEANIFLGDADNTKDLSAEKLAGYDFVFLPISLEACLEGFTIDLLINTHSLGEVPPEISRYWFNFFQNKINTRQFFTVNRFLNRRKWGSTYIGNVCSTGYDRDWHILDWNVDPKFMCSAHEVWESRYLMASGVRREVPLTDREASALSNDRCTDCKTEPWYGQLQDFQSTGGMALIDHNYAFYERNHDMSRTSSLFRCWDAARLYKSEESLTLMLHMLRFLAGGGRAFNEAHVYAADLESLYPRPFQKGNFAKYD